MSNEAVKVDKWHSAITEYKRLIEQIQNLATKVREDADGRNVLQR